MNRLHARYAALPRAIRWSVLFVAFIVVYLGVIEPIMGLTGRLNQRADLHQIRLSTYQQQAEKRAQADNQIARGTIRFGDVQMPDAGAGRSNELFTRISEILSTREIARPNVTAQRPIPIKLDAETQDMLAGPSRELQRLIFDIRIEGTPEAIAGVIADLERTPQVTSISQIVLRRVGRPEERKISATILPETWVIAERGGRR